MVQQFKHFSNGAYQLHIHHQRIVNCPFFPNWYINGTVKRRSRKTISWKWSHSRSKDLGIYVIYFCSLYMIFNKWLILNFQGKFICVYEFLSIFFVNMCLFKNFLMQGECIILLWTRFQFIIFYTSKYLNISIQNQNFGITI